jgi:hypothetical protein
MQGIFSLQQINPLGHLSLLIFHSIYLLEKVKLISVFDRHADHSVASFNPRLHPFSFESNFLLQLKHFFAKILNHPCRTLIQRLHTLLQLVRLDLITSYLDTFQSQVILAHFKLVFYHSHHRFANHFLTHLSHFQF